MKKKFNVGRFLRALSMATLITSLLCMCVVGVFARYKSEISGTATMRVAKWDVQVTNNTTKIEFNQSNNQIATQDFIHTFKVINNSEVTMEFSVKVVFTAPPPANVKLWIDNEATAQVCDGHSTEYILVGGIHNIGDGEKEHQLHVQCEYIKDGKLVDFSNFPKTAEISVIAEQVN